MKNETSGKSKAGPVLPVAETCPGKIEIPTKSEQEALGKMKAIKERVRELKNQLKRMEEDGLKEDSFKAQQELDQLKAEWETWETKRKEAAKERMIFLGHEEPEEPQKT
jgi:hypothetical protein